MKEFLLRRALTADEAERVRQLRGNTATRFRAVFSYERLHRGNDFPVRAFFYGWESIPRKNQLLIEMILPHL